MRNSVFITGHCGGYKYYCFFNISDEIGTYKIEFCDTKEKLDFRYRMCSEFSRLEGEKKPYMPTAHGEDWKDLQMKIANKHCLYKHNRTLKEYEIFQEIKKIDNYIVSINYAIELFDEVTQIRMKRKIEELNEKKYKLERSI